MKFWSNAVVFILPLILDRITKLWALHNIQHTSIDVNEYVRFELLFNRGISWGMFNSTSSVGFIVINLLIVAAICLVCWFTYIFAQKEKSLVGLLLILSGALSNGIDRFMYPGVIDFIAVHYYNWFWPTFNIADVAIEFGAVWLIIQGFYTSWE